MNKEKEEIKKAELIAAELIAVLTNKRDILNELLAYSRQGLSISTIVEYAALFTVLNDSEYYKSYDILEKWEEYINVPTEDELREYYDPNLNYDILFDNTLAWEEHEAAQNRNKQLKEIAIQAALEGVEPNILAAFEKEYLANDCEVELFHEEYARAKRAAEGRFCRCGRND